ncbi:Tankyrase-1, partial [Gryllus bimaculatus]
MAAICSWTVLPSSEAAERALGESSLQSSGRHVHWLHCASEAAGDDLSALCLLWKGSRGSAAAVAPFVVLASDACSRAPTCVHAAGAEREAAAWRPRAGLLVGEPGMGKTQFLQRLAAEARARKPQRWAVVVQALRHRHLLQRFPEPPDLSKEHLLGLLTGAACGVASGASLAEVTRRCLRAALEDTGEIAVLVDGVDEICPAYKDKLIRLLEILLETKVKLVWVSSRPEHWASLHGCSAAVFEPLAREMVDSLLDAEGGRQRSLLDVPLHVQMAAETYEPLAAHVLHAGGGQLPKGAFSLYDLYRRFVDKKRELFKQRFGLTDANFENISLVDNFDEVHQNCAILELVSDGSYGDVNVLPFKNYLENNKRNIIKEKNGILWMEEEGMHRFVHYTFMEYFAASWMVSHINDQETALDLAKEIWRRQFHQKRFSKLRHILEHMLSEGLPLHRAVLEGSEGALEAALASGACDLDACDRLGRTALVQAASLGRGGAVGALLGRGCDAGRRDALLGWTALRFASAGAHLDAAERLLQAGASAHHLVLDDAHDAVLKAAKFGLAK